MPWAGVTWGIGFAEAYAPPSKTIRIWWARSRPSLSTAVRSRIRDGWRTL
jgi:hypothetical protein